MRLSKIFALSLLLIGIPLIVFFGAAVHRSQEMVDPKPLNVAALPQDEQARALMSLAAAFAPNADKAQWIKLACAGMTTDGCDFFRTNQAGAMWDDFAGPDGASSGGALVETIVISDTAQFWRVHMIISAGSKDIRSDVNVLVERGADGNWYLNRILYGSGIGRPVVTKDSLPVTLAVAAMYAPNDNDGLNYWCDLVCSGMTAGGCEYFKTYQASEMWAGQIGHAADFVNSVAKVETINAVSEVWKVHLTIFISSKENAEQDIFVLVERGADDRWYLNRVLHGPGIQP